MLIFLDTAMRLSELLGLKIHDVDLENRTLKVLGKGAIERTVPFGFNAAKTFIKYLVLVLFSLLLVNIYGIGQKFIGWPAVQTMNPEYAKGYLLYLSAEDRISSTFAGHYDLAAYLVFLMPIVLGFYFLKKNLYYFLLTKKNALNI